jgi:sodium transport system permease protein
MNWSALKLLFIHEMRMLLRSRRTIITSIVLPLVMMPVMIVGSRYAQRQQESRIDQTTFDYAITGPWAAQARQLIRHYADAPEFKTLRIHELDVEDPQKALSDGKLHFYVRTLSIEDADKDVADDPVDPPGSGSPTLRPTGVPSLQVVYRGNQEIARNGAERLVDMMRAARRNESYMAMIQRGFPSHPDGILAMTASNVATESQVSGSTLGRFFTFVLVMWMVAAGSIAAMDIIAGEKERGTLETLITTAAGRAEIVTAKQLAICAVALSITFIQVLNALIYIRFRLIDLPKSFLIDLPMTSVVQLLILFIPLAAALSAALLIISAYAKTYKEAQLHFLPLYLGSMLPALAAVLPGLRSRSLVAFIPIANVSVAAREILMGRPDRTMIFVTFVVMSLTAAAFIRYSVSLLGREDLVVSAQNDQSILAGGESLFRRRLFQWFAVMWAIMFAVAANIPQLQSIRAQLIFNEIGIFLVGSLLMIRQYRLDIRKVLGIRRLRWPVWVAVLMAVPAAQVVAQAFFRLMSNVIPSPDELLREFSRQITAAPIPTWQLVFFTALLPAVCEELAFRGILLYGLRKRFHPVVRCLVVGIVFGIFHYTLFRIAPTALLGVIITAIAMMTGSVLPGMLFHAVNNAFAIWLESSHTNMGRLDWSAYVTAFAVFGLALHTIWRYGREEIGDREEFRGNGIGRT